MAQEASYGQSTSEEQWRLKLTKEQFRVLREKGTERAGTGQYDKTFEKGIYRCVGCDSPLYSYSTKFNSGMLYFQWCRAMDTHTHTHTHT